MRALEAVFSLWDQGYPKQVRTQEDAGYVNIVAIHSLKACQSCDYSSPKIVETIKGKDYSQREEKEE